MKKLSVIAIPSILGMLIVVAALSVALATPALAATKTVILDVPGMTCATCPITVKTALKRVEGVEKVEASLEKKQAVVTFDDAKTSVQKLIKATEDAGYPSSAAPVLAATRTVTLLIPSMHCAMCPVTVKKALTGVNGVSKVEVSLEKRDAVVTFDDAKTNVKMLMEATKNAGYPSTVER